MALDLAKWQRLGDQLGWRSQFRDPIPNAVDSDPRQRGYVDYLTVHHTATANEAVAADLMLPGGRTVTCNRMTGTDGKFRPNIPESRRAYTSASWLDDIADTTEVVNTSGGPEYGMADLSIMALAIWAVEKFRAGRLKAINRQFIIGHYEVLGISGAGYETSCPGPNTTEADRRLDLITEIAQAIDAGKLGPGKGPAEGADSMRAYQRNDGNVFFADDLGGENVLDYAQGLDPSRAKAAALALWGPEAASDPADVYIDYGKQIAGRRAAAKQRELAAAVVTAVGKIDVGDVTVDPAGIAKATADEIDDRARTRLS